MKPLIWKLVHPAAKLEMLGYIPDFIFSDDPRPAKEQINKRYAFGGWQPFGDGQWRLEDNHAIKYPGDPILKPLAYARLRDETIFYYGHNLVGIFQPDDSFEIARLD